MTHEVVVVGFGSPLRADDGLAWRVLDRLSTPDVSADLVACHQLMPELAETLAAHSCVVFVDASAEGEPGSVNIRPLLADRGQPCSHDFSPGMLLAFAEALYGKAPQAYIASITGADFGVSTDLTEVVEAQIARLVNEIRKLIMTHFQGEQSHA